MRTEKKVKVKVEEEEKINGQLDAKNLAKNMKSEEEKNRMAKIVPVDPSVRHLGEDGEDVPEDQCECAAFISHHQADGSHQVLWLGAIIEGRLKEQGKRLTTVWIDKKGTATVDGMNEGVRLSRHFILFLTKGVLSWKFCRDEISNALKYRKNVILVYQTDERHGGIPGPFVDFYGKELKKWFPNADDYKWLMRNSCVQFYDRAEHVDVMLRSEKRTNGILDQMDLSDALDRRTRLLSALRMKYTGRTGRYDKPDTEVKRRLELEIDQINQQGTLRDDAWMDNENVRAYLEYLHTGAAAATAAAAAASQVWPRQHDPPPLLSLTSSPATAVPIGADAPARSAVLPPPLLRAIMARISIVLACYFRICVVQTHDPAALRRTRLLQALQWKPNTVVRTKADFDIEQIKQGRLPDTGWLEEENIRAYLDSVCDDLEKMFAQVKPRDVLSGRNRF